MKQIYLDNQATTPIDPNVLSEMLPWLKEKFGFVYLSQVFDDLPDIKKVLKKIK